ncbi:hypothetical protein ACQ859_17760 [Roseateles chitinivorans]|uniref:hypothetical protein n=1 Tax=Roseateles chitinivorans TaxID=2917965 RepID=UPI003D674371
MGERWPNSILGRVSGGRVALHGGQGPAVIEEQTMPVNPYESSTAERAARSDPELIARVQAIETVLPTLATRAQLEQLRGEMKEGLGAVRVELKEEAGTLRAEMKDGFAAVNETIGALRAEMKDGTAAVNETIGALRAEMKDGTAAVNETIGALRAEMKDGTAAMNVTIGALRAEMKDGTAAMNVTIGALRAEMKEGFGAGRAEMHKTTSDHHLATQGVIFGAIKWSVGFVFGLIGLAATVFAAVSPFIKSH